MAAVKSILVEIYQKHKMVMTTFNNRENIFLPETLGGGGGAVDIQKGALMGEFGAINII
jgi:hypothetical protein